jgi:hypothetical protein
LPDALPEFDQPSAPHRGRAAIFTASFIAYAAVLAVAVGLAYGALPLFAPAAPDAPPELPQISTALTSARPPGASSPVAAASIAAAPRRAEADRPAGTTAEPTAVADGARVTAPSPPLPSCEQAADTYRDDLSEGTTALPRDMTGSGYGALLDGPATQRLLTRCAARGWRHVELCVAVRGFRAVGITVQTDPNDASVERCIARTIADLSFSHQPVLRVIRTEMSLLPER